MSYGTYSHKRMARRSRARNIRYRYRKYRGRYRWKTSGAPDKIAGPDLLIPFIVLSCMAILACWLLTR